MVGVTIQEVVFLRPLQLAIEQEQGEGRRGIPRAPRRGLVVCAALVSHVGTFGPPRTRKRLPGGGMLP